jgi:hypothetical protein
MTTSEIDVDGEPTFLNIQAELNADGSGVMFGYWPRVRASFISYIPALEGGPPMDVAFPFSSCAEIEGWYSVPGLVVANACADTPWRGAEVLVLITCDTFADGSAPDPELDDQALISVEKVVVNGDTFDGYWSGTFHYSGAFQVVRASPDDFGGLVSGDGRITGMFSESGGFTGALATLSGADLGSDAPPCGETALLSGERFGEAA